MVAGAISIITERHAMAVIATLARPQKREPSGCYTSIGPGRCLLTGPHPYPGAGRILFKPWRRFATALVRIRKN